MDKKEKEKEKLPALNQSNTTAKTLIKISSATAYKIIKYGTHKLDLKFRFNESKISLAEYKEMDLLNPDNWEQIKWSDFCCKYSLKEFCDEMGITDGGKQRDEIRKMLDDVTSEKIVLHYKDRDKWFPWFVEAEFVFSDNDFEEQSISLRFNPGVIGAALVSKNERNEQYAHLELLVIGKIKSFYALRIYELIQSFYNKKGRYGNNPGEWNTDWYTLDFLKKFLQCENGYIGRTDNFIQKAIKNPIEEINNVCNDLEVNLIVGVEFERGGRGGKQIKKIRFICSEKSKEIRITEKDNEETKKEKRIVNNDAIEMDFYKEKYKDNWDFYLEKVMELNPNNLFLSSLDKNSPIFDVAIINYIKDYVEK